MSGTYTLELELFSVLNATTADFEIYADGSLVASYNSISSNGTSTIDAISFGGALPTSLEFRFNDTAPGSTDQISIRSVRINGRSINTENYLSTDTLNDGGSSTVSLVDNDFLFDDSDPVGTTFTTGATETFTAGVDVYDDYDDVTPQTFDMLAGNDIAYLGNGADTVSGGADNDRLFGRGGDDLLFGDAGNDKLDGGAGNDSLFGGIGRDRLFGGDGNDELSGGDDNDSLNGNDGNDTLYGGDGNDRLNGSNGEDNLFGDDGDDVLVGGIGNDSLDGGIGDDLAYGGDGADIIYGGDGEDTLVGDDGNDTIHGGNDDDVIFGKGDDDTIFGDAGADFIDGGTGIDIIDGGIGNDILKGGAGADTIIGGDGDDILHGHSLTSLEVRTILNANPNVIYNAETNSFYEYRSDRLFWEDARADALSSTLGGQSGHLANVTTATENSFVTGLMAQTFAAIGANDVRSEGRFIWTDGIEAGLQFWQGDRFGNAVNNQFNNFTVVNPNNSNADDDYVYLRNNEDWSVGANTFSQRRLIEWDAGLINDDDAIDTLTGGDGNDTIYGYGGNDILNGEDGIDIIFGGEGDDTIDGGTGNDVLFGGAGNDDITGGSGNDTLKGNAGNDIIDGGIGNDEIDGGDNNDTITGGVGADTIYGGAGIDDINGNDDDDFIDGGADADTIAGDDGNDILVGGSGADTITGGVGNDTIHGHGLTATEITTILNANPDIVFNAETNSFYQNVASGTNHATAYAAATAATINGVAGHLANVTSANELTYITTELMSSNETWIGASDADQEGRWTWTDGAEAGLYFWEGGPASFGGTPITGTYNSWPAAGNLGPNNAGAGQDVTFMFANGEWDDTDGSFGFVHYVIEWDAGLIIDDNAIDNLSGGDGNDTIYGYGGNDILDGGNGSDTIFGGDGNDNIEAGAGADNLYGGDGADLINGGADNDIIDGGAGNDTLNGGLGNDTISAGNNNDTVNGGDGDDILDGGQGRDNIDGGIGNDTITLSDNHFITGESIDGGSDDDELILGSAITVDFTIGTLTGLETLTGSSSADVVTISGAQLNQFNMIDFNAGTTDTLSITSTSTGLNSLSNANLSNLEIITATTAGAGVVLDLSAQTEDFDITGSSFADTLSGGNGNDTFNLANGDFDAGESIDGNGGTDEIILTDATTVDFTTGTLLDLELLTGSLGNDDVTYTFEQALDFTTIDFGGGASDNSRVQANGVIDATGFATPTVINAENGFIVGSTGNDDLTITGAQLDTFIFGAGIIDFDTGSDVLRLTSTSADLNALGATDASILELEEIDASGAAASVTIDLGGQTEGFTVTGSNSSDNITTGSGDDIINSGLFGDTIDAGAGDDTIDGGNGLDDITGGLGNDVINGGQGADTLYAFNNTVHTEGNSFNVVNEIIFQENFGTNTGAFAYTDGGFGGTDPANADVNGTRITTDGNAANGALSVFVDGQDNTAFANASGSWDASFTAGSNLTGVQMTFSYRHIHQTANDTGEDSQVYFEFDGILYNQSGASDFISEAYGAAGTTDTGWVTVTIDLPDLTSGTTYDLSMGILHLGSNVANEDAEVRFDDVLLTAGTSYGAADTTIADADSGSNNTVNGGDQNDTIYGSAGINVLNGDAGDDTIYSGTVADEVLFTDTFDANVSPYAYADGVFGSEGTSNNYASGTYAGADGSTNAGSLSITLGGIDNNNINNISGAFQRTFTLSEAKNDLVLNFDFRLFDSQTGSVDPFDPGEDIELYADINGTTYSNDANPFFFELLGVNSFDANDTGWTTVSLNIGSIGAGTHTLSLGALLTRKTFQPEEYTLRFDDVSLVDTAILNVNTLNGGDGLDTLYGSSGRDVFMFEAVTAFADTDIIENFGYTLDAIDLSALLTGFDPLSEDINNFVQLTESGGNTTVSVDTGGTGSFVGNEVTVINGVTGMDVDVMQADGTLIF